MYYINRAKNVYVAVIGTDTLETGLNIVGAHIDSPRLDLKPNPLYEDSGFAYLKTHYYGGIKKYQWTTIPLSIHGVIVKTTGEKIRINIGEDEEDPIFTITDLLPHLAQDQMEKKLKNGIDGEDLAVLLQLKSPRVIYDWESGMKIPNAENLYNLALIFNMKMEDLLVMR